MSNQKECFVPIGEFDINRVVIDPPTQWGTTFKVTTSRLSYLNEDGTKCKLYLEGPPQTIFGISPVLETGHTELADDDSNLKGYQFAYPARSKDTKDAPTENELYIERVFDEIRKKAIEECKKDSVLDEIPASARGLVEGKPKGVKHVFNHAQMDDPKKKGKKIADPNSIKRSYIKLLTRKGNSGQLSCQTVFYGPGNVKISPVKYLIRQEKEYHVGLLEPNFHIEGLYWGTHGEQPIGCSIQIRLAEANFTPIGGNSSAPTRRMIKPNKSAPVEESPEVTTDRSTPVESEGFEKGGNVRKSLMNIKPKAVKKPAEEPVAEEEPASDEVQEEEVPPPQPKPKSKAIQPKIKSKPKPKPVEDEDVEEEEL